MLLEVVLGLEHQAALNGKVPVVLHPQRGPIFDLLLV